MGPGEEAALAAKNGIRYHLEESDISPGAIAWMPWAGVINETHKDRHKGKGDGVELVGEAEGGRPRQRAWNHPAIIIKKATNDRVYILPLTTFKGTSLVQKFAKHRPEARRYRLARILPIKPSPTHPFFKEGQKEYAGLKLAGDVNLHLPSHVKLDSVYLMDWKDLQRYDKSGRRKPKLDEDSTERLLSMFKTVNKKCWKEIRGKTLSAASSEE